MAQAQLYHTQLATREEILDVQLDGRRYMLVLKVANVDELCEKKTQHGPCKYTTVNFVGKDPDLKIVAVGWNTNAEKAVKFFSKGEKYRILFTPIPSSKRTMFAKDVMFDIPLKSQETVIYTVPE
uniref:Uncharacterized protein n=1 Tax=Panagrolaimus sp. JU765 TaxID=591449 RepID=A0AC34PYV7_9BILA